MAGRLVPNGQRAFAALAVAFEEAKGGDPLAPVAVEENYR